MARKATDKTSTPVKKLTEAEARKAEKMALLKKRLKGSLVTGQDFKPKEWLKFGNDEIDSVMSNGKGFPRGIIMEVCGKSQAGKTKLCYDAIAWCNSQGLMAGFANVENGFYDERAIEQGVKVYDENLFAMVEGCVTAEEYAEAIIAMVESELFALIVADSISAMVPADELDKDYGSNATIGIHARFVKKLTSQLNQLCKKHNTTVIFINQFRSAQSGLMGKMVDKPTGGVALEHYSRIRLWVERVTGDAGKMLDVNNKIVGGYTKFNIMKGNYGGQGATGTVEIPFVKADRNPVGEFMFKVKSQAKYDLKGYFVEKKATKTREASIQYIDINTGVVEAEANNPNDFIRALLNAPAPDKFVKAGKGESAFDFVAQTIRMFDAQKRTLLAALDNPQAAIVPASEVSDDDVLPGGLNMDDVDTDGEDLESEEEI